MMRRLVCLLACLVPFPLIAQVPEWAIRATVKVNDWHGNRANSGTGTIVDYDPETKTCLVLTCRHVVELEHGKIDVVTWDNYRVPAKFVGVHELKSPQGADITVLEIPSKYVDTFVPISRKPLAKDESICQVGWGGGKLNKRVGRFIGKSGYSNGGWRFHWNDEASFPAISGDSGSGIFSPERRELVGVLWGGDNSTSLFCGPEYCQQAYELCRKRRGSGSGRNGVPNNPGSGAPPVPTMPVAPSPGAESKPPPAPAAEFEKKLDALRGDVGKLNAGMEKMTDAICTTAQAVGDLAGKVQSMDSRLAAAEKARCQCPIGAGAAGSVPPPTASPGCSCKDKSEDIIKLQQDMERLRKSLKSSGTLRFNLEPRK